MNSAKLGPKHQSRNRTVKIILRGWNAVRDHIIALIGVFVLIGPIAVAFITSTHDAVTIHIQGLQIWPGLHFLDNYNAALLEKKGFSGDETGLKMMLNSFILGIGFASGKAILSIMAAYAIVYFRFPFASAAFWLIFATLLLPLEVRIFPSYDIVASFHMLNSYAGLIVPLLASATGTFFFRQFLKTIPDELIDAARIDGAGPYRFFFDIILPISLPMLAAIFIIMFVAGWNEYLWPLLITTDEGYFTLVRGIKQITQVLASGHLPEYGQAMALAILAMLPPGIVVIVFQRWFIKGLLNTDK